MNLPPPGPPTAASCSALSRIVELFPPRSIDATTADQLAAFLDPYEPRTWLAGQLAREPRQADSFVLVAHVAAAVGFAKLQHGRKCDAKRAGICWIRELIVAPSHRRRGIGSELVRRAWELVQPHEQLAVEIDERDTAAHLFLAAAGLECLAPWLRKNRQRERRVYEFRSVRPSAPPWLGRPRFTWPPGG